MKKPRTKKIKEIPLSPFDETLKILGYIGTSTLIFSLAYFKDEQAKESLQYPKEHNTEAKEANKDGDMNLINTPQRITTPINTKLP